MADRSLISRRRLARRRGSGCIGGGYSHRRRRAHVQPQRASSVQRFLGAFGKVDNSVRIRAQEISYQAVEA